MKMSDLNSGIILEVDDSGRVLIPKPIRLALGFNERTRLEVFMDGNNLLFTKHEPYCIFCKNDKNLIDYKGKFVCKNCASEISEKEE